MIRGSPSTPELVVLQALRCIGFSGRDRLEDSVEIDSRGFDRGLRELEAAGLVEHRPGPFGGWGITEQGREAISHWLEEELEKSGARPAIEDAYGRFLTLNPSLLEVCGNWQMRNTGNRTVLNDHRDPDYDAQVLDRLMRLDNEAQPLCSELAAILGRFSSYGPRLASALERALAGDGAYVTERLDSYHTVWFQLHEDLLTTLGISRHDER